MELLLAFFIAIGLVSPKESYSTDQITKIQVEYHDKLVAEYGDQYLIIVGTDETEKD